MRKLVLTLGGLASACALFACGGRTLLDADPNAQFAGGGSDVGGSINSGGASAGFANTDPGGTGGGFAGFPVAGGGPPSVGGSPTVGGSPAIGGSPPVMGGAGAGGSSPKPPSVCDGLGTRVLSTADAFIDDFECVTKPCAANHISADWSTFNDLGAPGADAADNMIQLLQELPGYASAHAGQYKGSGANTSKVAPGFGVGAVLNLAIDPTLGTYCVDISAFDGVSFWAKTEIYDSAFNVEFVLPNTNAEGKDPNGKENGGDCLMGCYQHPRKTVALSRTWEPYTVAFSATYDGSAKIKNVIQEIAFLNADATWDFSLDEIAFYKGKPPAPPLKP